MVDSLLVLHIGDEDDFGVAASNLLQSLQISDLHSSLAIELLSCQPHQFG